MDLSTVYKKPRKKAALKKGRRVVKKKVKWAPAEEGSMSLTVKDASGKIVYDDKPLLLCQKDKLALVASADPTRGMAPFDDKNYELWGLSVVTTFPDVKRLDLLFEMHPEGYYKRDPNVLKRLQGLKQPLYMLRQHDDIPMSMVYPMDIITSKYRAYHTSSISYMLALAYHSFLTTGKPNHVEMYGAHMSTEEEYRDQRACCEYWIGCMEAVGIKVMAPECGSLLMSASGGLYGMENYDPICWDMRQRTYGLQNGINDAINKRRAAEIQEAKNAGALYEANYWLLKHQRGEYINGRFEHGGKEKKGDTEEEGSTD